MNTSEVKELLRLACANYTTWELNADLINLWETELADYPYELAVKHLREHMHSNRFPPTLADIMRVDLQKERLFTLWLKAKRDDAFDEFVRNGGDPDAFDHASWDKIVQSKTYNAPDLYENIIRNMFSGFGRPKKYLE
ncbi:replicative helicase loader/inhibitor [Paenibacillus validus]|uniref:replicative helicase loader/inhibitor n=1 Tax=Paenibacillus validus TaxID=44253 RepID=UPI000FD85804|nr:replicative helicase loader/inhibitor [Paenibacillus validus]MED4602558.1 replicative helicase loader/inhibitor [Paenibacillus validus]MED4606083.1 replicative helicase loader/inhibitor [Paenibacillus validus]